MISTIAKRGDLAAVKIETVALRVGTYATSRHAYYALALITSVTRDGRVKRYRVIGDNSESKDTPIEVLIASKTKINVTKVVSDLEAQIKDRWDANRFATADAVREYLKPYVI